MSEPSLGQHLLAGAATMAVAFALLAVEHGVKDAAMVIGFALVGLILLFGSMPYTPPPRNRS